MIAWLKVPHTNPLNIFFFFNVKMVTLTNSVGVVGMGVMGKNLAANFASRGYPVALYNRSFDKTLDAAKMVDGMHAYREVVDFVQSLERPRKVILMLKAGDAVDSMAQVLEPLLQEGDVIVDGGNEWYENTERRQSQFLDRGIHWVGMGVSGGEKGARNGPSLMVGGDEEAYAMLEKMLDAVAAPGCMNRMGFGGSGHYVKMVHNGIEYGMMQAIAEVYWIMKVYNGMGNDEIADVFDAWNKEVFDCFLLEITCKILRKKDGEKHILDQMTHTVGMNGTGTWTAQEGLRMGVPMNTIMASVESRLIGSDKFARTFMDYSYSRRVGYLPMMIEPLDLQNALWITMMVSYAQGLQLLAKKNDKKKWDMHIGNAVRVWRDGCIIRSRIVHELELVSNYKMILSESALKDRVMGMMPSLRRVVGTSHICGVAVPAMGASLDYLEQLLMAKGPWALIQAQRDCFGSHGFERMDKKGTQHAQWLD